MSIVLLESRGITGLTGEEGEYVFSPNISSDNGEEYIVSLETFKFIRWAPNLETESTGLEIDVQKEHYAELLFVGEISPENCLDKKFLEIAYNEAKEADKTEDKEKKLTKFRSLEYGFFNCPIEAISQFRMKLNTIQKSVANAHDKMLEKLNIKED